MIRNAFVIGVTSSNSNAKPSGSTRPSFSAAFSGDVRVTVFSRWIGFSVMAERGVAAVRTGPGKTGRREFPIPDIPDARRYGYTSCENPYHLWGGFAQYMYLPWNCVIHEVPDNVSDEEAGIITPLSNGIEWALYDCGVGFMDTVLIQGPGQQGLSQ